MESMNISLPEPLKRFVDGQIASGRYSSVSEYVRELIREDERKKAGEALEALLLQGLQDKSAPFTPDDWKAIGNEVVARLKAEKTRS
ncbi:type II toxin-antitoxin system ParD family antitoxin [Paraburkholderia sp. A1RO-5]|uniref:type II toxin-antitoxin system ParD family antitoxin n=1 Tax=Paraburkholderia sp. A1RO-5 TaxID=3028369 RepID=UPI003B7D4A64